MATAPEGMVEVVEDEHDVEAVREVGGSAAVVALPPLTAGNQCRRRSDIIGEPHGLHCSRKEA
jgi:hypothetical protein